MNEKKGWKGFVLQMAQGVVDDSAAMESTEIARWCLIFCGFEQARKSPARSSLSASLTHLCCFTYSSIISTQTSTGANWFLKEFSVFSVFPTFVLMNWNDDDCGKQTTMAPPPFCTPVSFCFVCVFGWNHRMEWIVSDARRQLIEETRFWSHRDDN